MQFNQQNPTKIQVSDFTNTEIIGDLDAFMYIVMITYKHDNMDRLWTSYNNTVGINSSCGQLTTLSDDFTDYNTFYDYLIRHFSNLTVNKRIYLQCKTKDKETFTVVFKYIPPQKIQPKNEHERCTIF